MNDIRKPRVWYTTSTYRISISFGGVVLRCHVVHARSNKPGGSQVACAIDKKNIDGIGNHESKTAEEKIKMETKCKPRSRTRAEQKENAARKNGTWKGVICANVLVVSMGIKSMMSGHK